MSSNYYGGYSLRSGGGGGNQQQKKGNGGYKTHLASFNNDWMQFGGGGGGSQPAPATQAKGPTAPAPVELSSPTEVKPKKDSSFYKGAPLRSNPKQQQRHANPNPASMNVAHKPRVAHNVPHFTDMWGSFDPMQGQKDMSLMWNRSREVAPIGRAQDASNSGESSVWDDTPSAPSTTAPVPRTRGQVATFNMWSPTGILKDGLAQFQQLKSYLARDEDDEGDVQPEHHQTHSTVTASSAPAPVGDDQMVVDDTMWLDELQSTVQSVLKEVNNSPVEDAGATKAQFQDYEWMEAKQHHH